MLKKSAFAVFLLSFLAIAVCAESLNDKEQRLESQRKDLELQMHTLRVDLIKQDADLSLLYQKIMALHKELQIKIDNKPAMKKLTQKAAELDNELKELAKKRKQ